MYRSAIRSLHGSVWKTTSRHLTTKESIAEKVAAMSPTELVKNTVKVSDWNKRLLVFAGRFKTMKEIPDVLPFEVVDRARNFVRIKVCNIMIVAALIGFVVMSISGKRAAEAGDSIIKQNLDWHREYNEKSNLAEAQK